MPEFQQSVHDFRSVQMKVGNSPVLNNPVPRRFGVSGGDVWAVIFVVNGPPPACKMLAPRSRTMRIVWVEVRMLIFRPLRVENPTGVNYEIDCLYSCIRGHALPRG